MHVPSPTVRSDGALRQVLLFAAGYLLYGASRWVVSGDEATAPAVPSLHCGFALAVSVALARYARRRRTRALALVWAPTIFLAVVATGNHFLFDIAAGVTITVVGFAAARLAAERRGEGRHRAPRTDAVLALATHGSTHG